MSLLEGTSAIQCFPISPRNQYFALQSPAQADFAILNSRTTKILWGLSDLTPIRYEAFFAGHDLGKPKQQWKRKGNTIGITVSINIYGLREIANDVGRRLSKAGIYLQHPYYLDKNFEYDNPHYFKLPGRQAKEFTVCDSSPTRGAMRQPQVVNIVKIFESLDQGHGLQNQNVDSRIKTPLLWYFLLPNLSLKVIYMFCFLL